MQDELFNFRKNALMGVLADPLCEEYKTAWAKAKDDKAALVALSLRQQAIPYFATHCAQKKGVSRKYLLSNFDKYINGYTFRDCDGVEGYTYGLYAGVEPQEEITAEQDVAHLMWCVGTTVIVPQTKCPHIYVSNHCKVHIVCEGYNSVMLSIFDNSLVTVEDSDAETTVTAFLYGGKARAEQGKYFLGKLKQHQKELRL